MIARNNMNFRYVLSLMPLIFDALYLYGVGFPSGKVAMARAILGGALQVVGFSFIVFAMFNFRFPFEIESIKKNMTVAFLGGILVLFSSDVLLRAVYYSEYPAFSKTRGESLPSIGTRVSRGE